MPKINDYGETRVQLQGGRLVSSEDTQQLGKLNQARSNFGGLVQDAAGMIYKRKAQSEVSDLSAKFAQAQDDFALDIEQRTKDGTITTESAQEAFRDFVNKQNEGIETSEGRQFFDSQSVRLGSYITKRSSEGQAIAAGEKAIADITVTGTALGNQVLRNPKDFNDALLTANEGIQAQMDTGVLGVKVGEQLKRNLGAELSRASINGMIRQSPSAARQALDKGVYDQYLDPDKKAQLYNSIDSEIRSRQEQYQRTMDLKDKSPWQFLAKIGDTGGVKPIDLGEGVAESFKQRAEFIKAMEDKHGMKIPFLSENEAKSITRKVMEANPEDAVNTFANIASNVGQENQARFFSQIYKDEPGLAAAGMIAGDSRRDADKVVAGMSLLRNGGDGRGKAVTAPAPDQVNEAFDAYVGNATDDAGARQASRQAIVAHMVKTKFDAGDTDLKNFSTSDFENSAKAIIGPKLKLNGPQTMSFRGKTGEFLDEDQFSDLVNNLTDAQVQAVMGDVPRARGGVPLNLEKSSGRINLKPAGDGLYYVYRDQQWTQPARNKNGKPFVLDLKAVEQNSQIIEPKLGYSKPGGIVAEEMF